MIGSSRVHNFQGIWPDTGDLFVLNQPQFANSSVNNNPYPNHAYMQANTRGPRNPLISSLDFYSPQTHSSSSGTFMPSLSDIAYPSVNSNPTNTNFWGTQTTRGAGNMLDSNKGFLTPIGYDSLVTSSSNFGEGSSSGPYIVQEEQEPPFGFNISEPLSPLVFHAANESENPLCSPAPTTQPPVAMIEPRKNAPIVVNSPDQQNYGYGYLQDVVYHRRASKDIQFNGLDNNAPENRSALPSNESSNLISEDMITKIWLEFNRLTD